MALQDRTMQPVCDEVPIPKRDAFGMTKKLGQSIMIPLIWAG
jgi:hypothetical protein